MGARVSDTDQVVERAAPRNPKPFERRYLLPIRVTLSARDAKYAGEGVEPGEYELTPSGSWKRVTCYRVVRRVQKKPQGGKVVEVAHGHTLRRVKHQPTIVACVNKANGQRRR